MSAALAQAVAIVPVKRFDRAKSRLAAVFAAHEREALMQTMLRDTLSTLSDVNDIRQTFVVTGDPVASDIAGEYGAAVVRDAEEAGTNAAIARGLAALDRWTGPVLALPADLPCLSATAVRQVLDALRTAPVVIAPAFDGGTAALGLQQAGVMATAFGCGSFERHLQAARRAGLRAAVVNLGLASRDLDTPQDFVELQGRAAGARTSRLLLELQMSRRCSP